MNNNEIVMRRLTSVEQSSLAEGIHNLAYDKKSKYKKKGAPETMEQFEEYKKDLEEISMLENLKTLIESGCIKVTPPEGQGSTVTVTDDEVKKAPEEGTK